jgi:hypothetical protein
MSRLPIGLTFVIVLYGCFLVAIGACLLFNPIWTFRTLSFGKPVPKFLENRVVAVVSRVVGALVLLFVFRVVVTSLQS